MEEEPGGSEGRRVKGSRPHRAGASCDDVLVSFWGAAAAAVEADDEAGRGPGAAAVVPRAESEGPPEPGRSSTAEARAWAESVNPGTSHSLCPDAHPRPEEQRPGPRPHFPGPAAPGYRFGLVRRLPPQAPSPRAGGRVLRVSASAVGQQHRALDRGPQGPSEVSCQPFVTCRTAETPRPEIRRAEAPPRAAPVVLGLFVSPAPPPARGTGNVGGDREGILLGKPQPPAPSP